MKVNKVERKESETLLRAFIHSNMPINFYFRLFFFFVYSSYCGENGFNIILSGTFYVFPSFSAVKQLLRALTSYSSYSQNPSA